MSFILLIVRAIYVCPLELGRQIYVVLGGLPDRVFPLPSSPPALRLGLSCPRPRGAASLPAAEVKRQLPQALKRKSWIGPDDVRLKAYSTLRKAQRRLGAGSITPIRQI